MRGRRRGEREKERREKERKEKEREGGREAIKELLPPEDSCELQRAVGCRYSRRPHFSVGKPLDSKSRVDFNPNL